MTLFEVWAPHAGEVALDLVDGGPPAAMVPAADGWWRLDRPDVGAGRDYGFRLDGGQLLPDPRSRHQPHGVHGPSRVVDPAGLAWTDGGWRGVPLPGAVVYELHVGTFTAEGTFDAAIGRLDHLVYLGVDLVELLPVNAFPGERDWGYDGVGLYAVQESYGGPAGLARLVDACHARGLGVLMDVVLNHFGPEGNYLSRFGPYLTDLHRTPWGPAVNLDGPASGPVRRFLVDVCRQWVLDYHVDGLRLDAVHALVDSSAVHLLEQIGAELDAAGAATGRHVLVVAESDLNDPRLVRSRDAGGYGLHAAWSDDLHHAIHSALTGERDGYYVDFGSLAALAGALRHGYTYRGQYSPYRGRPHGRPTDGLPAYRLLGYTQNHDQVGNRACGERLVHLVGAEAAMVAAALVLTAPFTPMIFMGEEWAASTRWPFFTDYGEPDLARAVREGRRAEFAAFGWAPEAIPDPQDPATRRAAVLDWTEPGRPEHARMLAWYRDLLALRRRWPQLTDPDMTRTEVAVDADDGWLVVRRPGGLAVVAVLGAGPRTVPVGAAIGQVLLASRPVRADGAALVTDGPAAAVVRLAGAAGPS